MTSRGSVVGVTSEVWLSVGGRRAGSVRGASTRVRLLSKKTGLCVKKSFRTVYFIARLPRLACEEPLDAPWSTCRIGQVESEAPTPGMVKIGARASAAHHSGSGQTPRSPSTPPRALTAAVAPLPSSPTSSPTRLRRHHLHRRRPRPRRLHLRFPLRGRTSPHFLHFTSLLEKLCLITGK